MRPRTRLRHQPDDVAPVGSSVSSSPARGVSATTKMTRSVSPRTRRTRESPTPERCNVGSARVREASLQGPVQCGRQLPAGLQVRGLIDRLMRHQQSVLGPGSPPVVADSPDRVTTSGPTPPSRVVKSGISGEHVFFRSTPQDTRPLLRRHRPIGPPARLCAPPPATRPNDPGPELNRSTVTTTHRPTHAK